MQVVNAHQFVSNPSTALRSAKDHMVVVNCGKPEALLIGFEHLAELADMPDFVHACQAMAVSLFRDGLSSVGGAAKMADESMFDMLTSLSRLGVPVVDYDEQALVQEVAVAGSWIKLAL